MPHWLRLLFESRLLRRLVLVMAPVLALVWWQLGSGPGEVQSRHSVGGRVIAVHEHAYRVALDDGGEVNVFRTLALARGARVQLLVTEYSSGERHYVLDARRPGAR